jgi:hypothetical protein
MRFDKTKVPAAETTYMCQMFDIPSEGDWHVIGNIPLIDNANVMHHTVVYLCTDEEGEWFCVTAIKGVARVRQGVTRREAVFLCQTGDEGSSLLI